MTANIGSYDFIASSVVPSTLDTQMHDSTTTLFITGYSSDPLYPKDKIVLSITKYKAVTGTWSIAQGQASATYYHNGLAYAALGGSTLQGGIVSISNVTSTSLIGYFSFNTDSLSITHGSFNVGLP